MTAQPVWITGLGLVTALGDRAGTWAGLREGRSAIRVQQPWPELPPWPLALVGATPAGLADLWQPALAEAIAEAGLALPWAREGVACGVVIGSSRGSQGAIEQVRRAWRSGQDQALETWGDLLPGTVAVQVARAVGSGGPVAAPMAACATGLLAIAQGADLIRSGLCDVAIVGAVEAAVTPLTLAGFRQMGALAQTTCRPFDRHREGFVLGEGAAIFVLESQRFRDRRSGPLPPVYGQILGAGFSADAHSAVAPEASGQAARGAVQAAIARSGLDASQIDFVQAHGTGTPLNDAREAALLAGIFGGRLPVSGCKGATGHTLGAAGAIGLALVCLAGRAGELPPTVGLVDPEFPQVDWVRSPRAAQIRHSLVLAFGFGGQNGAIVVQNREIP